jgi:dihydrofolate reductase
MQIWGSATLARQLIEHDLADEVIVMLEPILVGGGKRLWPQDGQARKLELVSAVPAATGTVVCTYKPVRS